MVGVEGCNSAKEEAQREVYEALEGELKRRNTFQTISGGSSWLDGAGSETHVTTVTGKKGPSTIIPRKLPRWEQY